MMLITDGIPTVSVWSSDPVMDAIKAASEIIRKIFALVVLVFNQIRNI